MVAQLHALRAQQNKHLLSVEFSWRERCFCLKSNCCLKIIIGEVVFRCHAVWRHKNVSQLATSAWFRIMQKLNASFSEHFRVTPFFVIQLFNNDIAYIEGGNASGFYSVEHRVYPVRWSAIFPLLRVVETLGLFTWRFKWAHQLTFLVTWHDYCWITTCLSDRMSSRESERSTLVVAWFVSELPGKSVFAKQPP